MAEITRCHTFTKEINQGRARSQYSNENFNCKNCLRVFSAMTGKPAYRYMYLKTYAKFTFCIKSQGHVSDENFLYYCMHPASKISSYGV